MPTALQYLRGEVLPKKRFSHTGRTLTEKYGLFLKELREEGF